MERVTETRIGEILVGCGALTPQQLQTALQRQRERGGLLGQILKDLGFVSEEQVAMALALQYGLPYASLGNGPLAPEAISSVSAQLARRYELMPVHRSGHILTIAVSDPAHVRAIADVMMLTNCEVRVVVSTPSGIRLAIDAHYPAGGS